MYITEQLNFNADLKVEKLHALTVFALFMEICTRKVMAMKSLRRYFFPITLYMQITL